MKENYEVLKMLKTMTRLDIITGLALGTLVGIINKNYLIISVLGFFMAIMSFYINAFLINFTILGKNENSKGIIILSFAFRLMLIGAIGLTLFTHNKFNLLAYIGGYIFRFLTLLMYVLIIKDH